MHAKKANHDVQSRPTQKPGPSSPQRLKRLRLEANSEASQRSAASATSSTRAVVGAPSSTSSSVQGKQNNGESFESSLRLKDTNGAEQCSLVIPESDPEEEDEDVVPPSPPPPVVNKARLFFKRCFDPTLNSEDLEDDQVYVPDSDED